MPNATIDRKIACGFNRNHMINFEDGADLGAVFATTYQKGRYDRSVGYTAAPPITLDDANKTRVMERAGLGISP